MLDSPCIKVCKIDPTNNHCLGCGRSLKEISEWIYLDEVEKKKVLLRLNNRFKVKLT